jgi:hypothetical protein
LTVRRHVLIVATQCHSQPWLSQLDGAAAGLDAVLRNGMVGACEPGLPDGRSLLTGRDLDADAVNALVRDSIRHAAGRSATLVLAFLGHGFVPGQDPTLYYMASNSRPDIRLEAVNVKTLLTEAADTPRINGVIGIIDTCHAAAGSINVSELTNGARRGSTRCHVLMASAVTQQAYDLRLSTVLARLLRSGLPGSTRAVTVSSLVPTLRREVLGQDTVELIYDGEKPAAHELWLARNVVHWVARPLVGQELAQASMLAGLVAGLGLPRALAEDLSLDGLRTLREALKPIGEGAERAVSIVDSLQVAKLTAMFLRAHLPTALGAVEFRRAFALTKIAPVVTASFDHEAILTHVALRYPQPDRTSRPQVAKFVVALAMDAKQDTRARVFLDWAESIEATDALSEARRLLEGRVLGDQLRLVISLHAVTPGKTWPETVLAWLQDRDDVVAQDQRDCLETRAGVELALLELVDWAVDYAYKHERSFAHIDIAVPTALLVDEWRPDDVMYIEALGDLFDVTVRWGDRLKRSNEMARAIVHATKRLADIAEVIPLPPPVDWLDDQIVDDVGRLGAQLRAGKYRRAIALPRRPTDVTTMPLLLTHSPIVLWPHGVDEFPAARRECLTACWHLLPDEFRVMYRKRRFGEVTGDAADLRAIWDDDEWLRFCRKFQHL